MKNLFLVALIFATGFAANAQFTKVVTAYNYLKDYETTKDAESLTKAKEAIDQASVNEKTSDDAKTFVYKGQIYLTIFDKNHRLNMEKLTNISDPNKKTLMAYQNTSATDLDEAYKAFSKGKQLDVKEKYTSEIKEGIMRIAMHSENKGVADYNAKKYEEALSSFERAYEINGVNDTSNLSNSALIAEKAGLNDKAKTYYQKMTEAKVGQGKAYTSLVNLYLATKDTVGGMAILSKGRAAFPNDLDLLISETNFYLKLNTSEKALANLNQAVKVKPNDPNLYLVRGNIYDNLANPKDAKGEDLTKPKNYVELLALAEADYKKAIELKVDYFDALYNLGVLYNNHGVAINKVADKITDPKKFDVENAKANVEFAKAMPVLEKALEVNPKDRNTMIALKQIYARMQLLDKLKMVNEKLKG